MRVSDFDFDLPSERIALRPASPRDAAKLLVVRPDKLEDHLIRELPQLLRAGDVLVFNNTRVIPAALRGHRFGRAGTSPKIEVLLHMRLDGARWKAFAKPARKLEPGDRVRFGGEGRVCLLGNLDAIVEAKGEAGKSHCCSISRGQCLTKRLPQWATCRCHPTSRESARPTNRTVPIIKQFSPAKTEPWLPRQRDCTSRTISSNDCNMLV